MVDAALVGDGFDRLAELAAEEAGPALEVAVVWPGRRPDGLEELLSFSAARVAGEAASFPAGVDLLVPITYGNEIVGSVAISSRLTDVAAPVRAELKIVSDTAVTVTVSCTAI